MTTLMFDNAKVKDQPVYKIDDVFFNSLEEMSAYSDLVRKMVRPHRKTQPVSFEFTRDEGLLQQYCILREEMFKKVWDLSHFKAQKDKIDDISHIIVAKQGLQCVGGGRITLSTPAARQKLPMEGSDFTLESGLHDLKLSECSYAEVTRIAVLSEYSKDNVITQLIDRIILKIISEQCKFLFFISPMTMTRTHRRVVNNLGYTLTTRKDVIIPDREEYEGIRMFLSYIDLTPYIGGTDDVVNDKIHELAEA